MEVNLKKKVVHSENPLEHWSDIEVVDKKVVLDLGCGWVERDYPSTPKYFISRGASKVIGVDPTEFEIEKLKQLYPSHTFVCKSISCSNDICELVKEYQPSLIKIDIEGAEIFLKDAPTDVFDSVEEFAIEYHNAECKKIVQNKFQDLGFEITACNSFGFYCTDPEIMGIIHARRKRACACANHSVKEIQEKTYFLITSYLANPYFNEKKSHLKNYIGGIRKYIKNSFIVLVDSVPDADIAKLCDVYICERRNFNAPHGQADLEKIKIGLSVLESFGAKWFIRSVYDYWMNNDVLKKVEEWISLLDQGKVLVSTRWKGEKEGWLVNKKILSMGYGCFTIEAAKLLFDFEKFTGCAEEQLYARLELLFHQDQYYLYESTEEMVGGLFFDVFNSSGNKLNSKRLDAVKENP